MKPLPWIKRIKIWIIWDKNLNQITKSTKYMTKVELILDVLMQKCYIFKKKKKKSMKRSAAEAKMSRLLVCNEYNSCNATH